MDIHDTHLPTHHDNIPNFAAHHTLHSAGSGDWDSPATWDAGRVPNATDVAVIKAGHSVSVAGNADVGVLGVEGILSFESSPAPITFKVGTLLVYAAGAVRIGSEAAPYAGTLDVVIADRPIDLATDPAQYGTGLLVLGEFIAHGQVKSAWHRVAAAPKAGDTLIEFEEAPVGWQAGDRLFLSDSHQYPVLHKAQTQPEVPIQLKNEIATVQSVSGATVLLASPLLFDHPGFMESDAGDVDVDSVFGMPCVGNLTRNVTFRSENPTGTRGHGMFTGRAKVDIRHTAWRHMGRTTNVPLGPWNQIGRYAVHCHHLMGPENPSNEGYQFRIDGNAFEDSRKWAVAIHNSHWGTCNGNAVYDAQGAGIVTELGNERGNEICRNFIAKMGTPITTPWAPLYGGVRHGALGNFSDIAWEGSGLWMAGNDNIAVGNVAATCAFSGIMYNSRGAGGFANHHPLVPKFRGADHMIPDQWDNYAKPYRAAPPVIESRNNEAYACATAHWVGFCGTVGTIHNVRGWNIRHLATYSSRNSEVHYDGYHMRSNAKVAEQNVNASVGIDLEAQTYHAGYMTWKNISARG